MRVSFQIGNEFLKRVRFFPSLRKNGRGPRPLDAAPPAIVSSSCLSFWPSSGSSWVSSVRACWATSKRARSRAHGCRSTILAKRSTCTTSTQAGTPTRLKADALIHKPGAVSNWAGPYLKGDKLPPDPWGNKYNYRSPGEHGKYDLYSYGADGREGGTGNDADITNWESAPATASNK